MIGYWMLGCCVLLSARPPPIAQNAERYVSIEPASGLGDPRSSCRYRCIARQCSIFVLNVISRPPTGVKVDWLVNLRMRWLRPVVRWSFYGGNVD